LQALKRPPIIPAREPRKFASWLQVMSHLDPRFGGIASSVPQFCRAIEAESGYRSPIAGFCDVAEFEHLSDSERAGVDCLPPGRMGWMLNLGRRERFRETIRNAQGLHIHGVWETHCSVAASLARACKRPYIISAHGMLDRWALQHKRIKKALYAALIETGNLQRAACLRALTADEADDYRRIGLRNPIAIIPSGVDVPTDSSAELFWEAHPNLKGQRIALFLGRLHPKKGLHLLLQAWARVARSAMDAHLVIAGPDAENTRAALERMVDDLNLRNCVTFAGMLPGPRKWSALAASHLFVLPSYSEGFSVAVLEALGMGLPVIVTHPCHIPEVSRHRCGWAIEPELAPLEGALEEFLQSSSQATAQMGQRGQALIHERFRWPVIGGQMAEVYDWALGGSAPTNVEMV
jgi:glycosyltransferase involved in cell wall biosynthesis